MATKEELDDGLTEEERAALQEDDGSGDGTESEDAGDDAGEGDAADDAGDDGADDSAADAGDDADPADEPADNPEGIGDEPDEPEAAQATAPLLVVDPVADAEAKLADIATKKEELATKFDDGDITSKEFQKDLDALNRQEREIERAVDKAQLAAEMEQQRQRNEWGYQVNAFLDSNPTYREKPAHYRELDFQVREFAKTEEARSMTGPQILAKAHELTLKALGIEQQATQQRQQQQTQRKPKPDAPPSLHAVPSAEINDTSGGKWAQLDKLARTNPIAYEEAVAKLSPQERDAYMAA